jgi:homoserine dehydrogenase
VAYAADAGCVIKLIAQTRREGGKLFAQVGPAFVPVESQLAGVDDVFNAILVRGDATGEVVFYGRGAGKLPTASAVIGDIVECVKAAGNIGSLNWADSNRDNVSDINTSETVCYVRCRGDKLKDLTSKAFGEVRFLSHADAPADECAFITPRLPLSEIISRLEGFGVLARIRLL